MRCLIGALSQQLWMKRREHSENQWHCRRRLRFAKRGQGSRQYCGRERHEAALLQLQGTGALECLCNLLGQSMKTCRLSKEQHTLLH